MFGTVLPKTGVLWTQESYCAYSNAVLLAFVWNRASPEVIWRLLECTGVTDGVASSTLFVEQLFAVIHCPVGASPKTAFHWLWFVSHWKHARAALVYSGFISHFFHFFPHFLRNWQLAWSHCWIWARSPVSVYTAPCGPETELHSTGLVAHYKRPRVGQRTGVFLNLIFNCLFFYTVFPNLGGLWQLYSLPKPIASR